MAHGTSPVESLHALPARLALALLLLNSALVFLNLWPTLWIRPGFELSLEVLGLLASLALLARLGVLPGPRSVALLACIFTLLALGRYADVTVPALFGRPINFYWDTQHLPRVAAMMTESIAWWVLFLACAAALVVVAATWLLLRWAWRQVAQAIAHPLPRRVLGILGASGIALFAAAQAGVPGLERYFARPVVLTYAEQLAFLRDALAAGGAEHKLPPASELTSDLQRVRGADVFVVFLESYGAVAFDNPEFSGSLAQARTALEDAVRDTGRAIVSARVESPTFGGRSWLAHASLLAGIEVREPGIYDRLLTTQRATLVTHFRERGFRTVALMPGLRSDWPEGAFYRFESVYASRELAYAGPQFGWWRIPDQFVLARLDQVEIMRAGREPLFVFFPTITSHVPFRPTPPYQPDWARMLTANPYDPEALRSALAQVSEWSNLGPAYVDTVAYDYATLAGYLRENANRDFVLVILGDHQPPAGVAGEGASWDVPVHIIASRSRVLGALRAAGFEDGLSPRNASLGRMHELTPILLSAFSSDVHGESDPEGQPGIHVARAGVTAHAR